jgi:hypothetical protein
VGTFDKGEELTLSPQGLRPDLVIVLDDADRNFAEPGTAAAKAL